MPASTFERVSSPVMGTVVSRTDDGSSVIVGTTVAVIESMKMEYAVESTVEGVVRRVSVSVGQTVQVGDLLMEVDSSNPLPIEISFEDQHEPSVADVRLEELRIRERLLSDDARPESVAKRRRLGLRTARENVNDLIDDGSFVEYGRFAYAAQTQRRSVDDLIANTPADGLVAGIATVNSALFGTDSSGCAVLSYDYMVLAGTQGQRNHEKKDRVFELVERLQIPVVFFTEGGGGRPGDTDHAVVTGLNTDAFRLFARLSGLVPTIGIAAGRCFAGNAALLGCCDVIIACANASIGMGGPAMIAGGGLGVVSPEDVGPVEMHAKVGSVDLVVADDADAVSSAKRILSYAQGSLGTFEAPDASRVGSLLPGDRRRAYDVRPLLEGLFDVGTVTELREQFGLGMVTALARLEGRPVGVLANNPIHLAGAIDADGADKAARFMQLLESWGLPVVTLVDTPGFMVGPAAEATGLVRHVSRMFVAGAAISVPLVSVVTRRGYGLGAQAMCGGSFTAPLITVAWPQAEMGGMGLEGAVRLGFRRELEAIVDDAEREATLIRMIDRAYENGRALNVAAHLEIDDVIDPATTRELIARTLRRAPSRMSSRAPRRFVDTW
jgi:acetyl-CoA carboxylase carboxyltransferase component